MNQPAPNAVVVPSGPMVEVLEYGKPCISLDGPIEKGLDYGKLGRTTGFPGELEGTCRPKHLGPGPVDALQPLLRDVAHATVLRPASCSLGVVPVLSRTRVRLEDPRRERDRRYWLGRYLAFTSTRPDPLSALRTMDAHPLVGLTRKQAASIGRPMDVVVVPSPRASGAARAFLAEAVPLVASGVPVGIAGVIDETTFFAWATLLWSLLPGSLQGLFSAGWTVTPATASDLTMSSAPSYPETVATFDPTTRSWTMPAVIRMVTLDGQAFTRTFGRHHLVPGTSFARVHLGWTPDHRPVKPLAASPRARRAAAAALRRFEGRARVLGMTDPAVVNTFCYPAYRSLDTLRVRELEQWLSGVKPAGPNLCVDTSVFRFHDMAQRAFDAGMKALGTTATQDRGDQVVSCALGSRYGSRHREAVARFRGPGAARAALFVAAEDGSPRRAVRALEQAIDAGEAAALPEGACPQLFDLLDASLAATRDGSWTRRVVGLLLGGQAPGIVRDWVSARADGLAVAVARDDAVRAPLALALIRAQASSAFVDLVIAWCTGGRPDRTASSVIAGVDETLRRAFGAVVVAAWREDGEELAERRSAMLPWIDLLGPLDTRDSLLCLRYEHERLSMAQTRELTNYVVAGAVPRELRSAVAAAMLHQYDRFRDAVLTRPRFFDSYLVEWPPQMYLTLVGTGHPAPPGHVNPRVDSAARASRPERAQLKKLVRRWTAPRRADELPKVAQRIWTWCTADDRSLDGPRDFIHVCADVAASRVPVNVLGNRLDMDRVARLAHAAGVLDEDSCSSFVSQCTRGWQLRFVLGLFPHLDIALPPSQLELLLTERPWLHRHLAAPGVHSERRRRLGLASHGFHQLEYANRSDRALWIDGIEETPLWAVFSGVPPKNRGPLSEAIKTYALTPRNRCRLALLFLEGQPRERTEEYEDAQDAVMEYAISPVALNCNLDHKTLKRILQAMGPRRAASKLSRIMKKAPRRVHLVEAAVDQRAVKIDSHHDIRVARWFRDALKAVGGASRSSRLLKIYRKAGGGSPA